MADSPSDQTPQVDSKMPYIETRLDVHGLPNQQFDEMEQSVTIPSTCDAI